MVFATRVLISSFEDDWTSKMTTLVSNDGRRTEFSATQLRSFFKRARLPVAAQRRTSMTGIRILSPALVNTHSVLMTTTVGNSGDPETVKAVAVSPREFSQWLRGKMSLRPCLVWRSWQVWWCFGNPNKHVWTWCRTSHMHALTIGSNGDWGCKLYFDCVQEIIMINC